MISASSVTTTAFGSLFFLIIILLISFALGRIIQEKFLIFPSSNTLSLPIGFLAYIGTIYVFFIPFLLAGSQVLVLLYWAIAIHGVLLLILLFNYRFWFKTYRVSLSLIPMVLTGVVVIVIFVLFFGIITGNDSASFFNRQILFDSNLNNIVNNLNVPPGTRGGLMVRINELFALQAWYPFLGLWIGAFQINASFFLNYTVLVLFAIIMTSTVFSIGTLITTFRSKYKMFFLSIFAIAIAIAYVAVRISPSDGEAWRSVFIFFLISLFIRFAVSYDKNPSILILIGVSFVSLFAFSSSMLFMGGLLLVTFTIAIAFYIKKNFIKYFIYLGLPSGINLLLFFFVRNIFIGIGVLVAWVLLHVFTIVLLLFSSRAIELIEEKMLKYRIAILSFIFVLFSVASLIIVFSVDHNPSLILSLWSAVSIASGELSLFANQISGSLALQIIIYVLFYGFIIIPALALSVIFLFRYKSWKSVNPTLYLFGVLIISMLVLFYNPLIAPFLFTASTRELYHRLVNGLLAFVYLPLLFTITKSQTVSNLSLKKSKYLKSAAAVVLTGASTVTLVGNSFGNPNVASQYANGVNWYNKAQNGLVEVRESIVEYNDSMANPLVFERGLIFIVGDTIGLANVTETRIRSAYTEEFRIVHNAELSPNLSPENLRNSFSQNSFNSQLLQSNNFRIVVRTLHDSAVSVNYIAKRRENVPFDADGNIPSLLGLGDEVLYSVDTSLPFFSEIPEYYIYVKQ